MLNIVYSFNHRYAQHAGLSLLSLLEQNKDLEEMHIYFISNWLDDSDQLLFQQLVANYQRPCSLVHLDLEQAGLSGELSFHPCAYGRILLAESLQVDAVVYVDSDTIIRGSFKELEAIDMSHSLVAGVMDTVNPYYLKLMGLPRSHRYICDGGIILLNLKLWRALGVTSKAMKLIQQYHGNPPHHDQGIINAVCQGAIQILPLKYNVMPPVFKFTSEQLCDLFRLPEYYSQTELEEAVRNPLVIHYTDEFFARPWQMHCSHPYKNYYLEQLRRSPWAETPLEKKIPTRNCRIQNWMVKYAPFFLYRWMIRYIEYKHEKNYLFSFAQ